MERVRAKSIQANQAYQLVDKLQQRFINKLTTICTSFGAGKNFTAIEWFRDAGKHGGGLRFVATDKHIFNRGSVNLSQVQYDDDKSKGLASATAISTIIHPKNPLAPSVHMHISWTELKDGRGYWRIMADLNPIIENVEDQSKFASTLQQAAPDQYQEAADQGDRYFYIPALGRHRGVTHFYLENYNTGNHEIDRKLATKIAETTIDCYCEILQSTLEKNINATNSETEKQLEYHTLYFFQVLTLDRGTTSGLLIHDQNDTGILGSLPSHINKSLVTSWIEKLQPPQNQLLENMIKCLPNEQICPIEDATKQKLAQAIREHYKQHPQAIDMQARGDTIPTTVSNHR